MWIGISAEENARRCKPSHEGWVTNRYPLRELGMTRVDCASWLLEHYQIVVPKRCVRWMSYLEYRPKSPWEECAHETDLSDEPARPGALRRPRSAQLDNALLPAPAAR